MSDAEEAKSRQVHDPENGTVDFGRMRATDAKGNTRVILPKPGSLKFEMELEAKKMEYDHLIMLLVNKGDILHFMQICVLPKILQTTPEWSSPST